VSKHSDTKIHLHQRPPKADDEFDITPMIDCVFLLLFFFMVTSKIDRQSSVLMPKAANTLVVIPSKTVVLTTKLSGAGEATVYLGDSENEEIALRGLPKDMEERIRQYIEQEIARRPEVTGIMVKSDGKVPISFGAVCNKAASVAGGGRPFYFGVEKE
jgi:biopolymer transport protein ExbD